MIFKDILSIEEQALFKKRTYLPNEVVFTESSICDYIGYVEKGKIEITTFTYNEKEESITLITNNNFFGIHLISSSNPIFLGDGIAKEHTIIYVLNKKDLLYLLMNNESFLKYYLNISSDDSLKIKRQAKLLAHKNIRDRIMFYFAANKHNNIIKIKSVENLSKELSLPRPSVSRELIKLENEKIIKRDKNTIYIVK